MPFPTKVQPVDLKGSSVRTDQGKTSGGGKSRLKRLFERQFQSVLRISSSEKLAGAGDGKVSDRDECGVGDQEPNSVCLVFSFMEDSSEKSSAVAAGPGGSRCICFNGNCEDVTDDEFGSDSTPIPACCTGDGVEILKSLVPCVSIAERNLLADASKIVEKCKIGKVKVNCRKIAASGLRDLGYDASVCKSRWEKTPSFPAGEYEYVDVIIDGDRYIIDVDFRSEFEIARSTKNYRTVLQLLPAIFVGKENRLQQIVSVVSEASRQSLKKKGLHFPPWRKAEYMRAKWLSPYQRTTSAAVDDADVAGKDVAADSRAVCPISAMNFSGEFEIRQGNGSIGDEGDEGNKITVVVSPWQPPAVKPKAAPPAAGAKIVAGLASVLREKPPSPIF
ncbi:uncharacterized protein LOC110024277 [Phalaenopsis equestris]|uniref:uncharacterized protein LOC110024277 n=1 Tax=Phalaenopsis equestris TaxID=78828 RepID=UPI0009E3BA64|nr:uncharacterized protein LOC110024277 [Phalaenopsis equestris]